MEEGVERWVLIKTFHVAPGNLTLLIVQCVGQTTTPRRHFMWASTQQKSKLSHVGMLQKAQFTQKKKKKESKLDTVVQALCSVIDIGESLCASITGCEIKNIICVCRVTGKRQYYRQVFMYWKSAIL